MLTLSPAPLRLRAKLFAFCLLLLGALGWQRSCTQQPGPAPTYYVSPPVHRAGAAVVSVAYRLPRPSGRWVRLADTVRAGGPAHLLRKASPRSRWLPAQPAYLPKLHRRPRQWLLDSLAHASMHRV